MLQATHIILIVFVMQAAENSFHVLNDIAAEKSSKTDLYYGIS